MGININVWKKNKEYVASCPELEIFCYGIDEKQARERLKKVIYFYVETASDLGYNINLATLNMESFEKTKTTGDLIAKNKSIILN